MEATNLSPFLVDEIYKVSSKEEKWRIGINGLKKIMKNEIGILEIQELLPGYLQLILHS